MEEVGEAPPELATQNMADSEAKEKDITFAEVKEKAWNVSQEALVQWKSTLEDRVEENTPDINQYLQDLSTLYGIEPPENFVVSLQYYPQEGSHKGEPINNFTETGRLERDFADVIYWLPNPSSIPKDARDEVLQKVLHEIQHISFGGEKFQELVRKSEQNPEVEKVLRKLEGVSGDYMEVTTELVVTYLENLYTKRTIENSQGESPPVTIEVDKEKFGKVLEAVIKEDVEGWRDKGKGPGPYTNLRQRWEKELGGLPEAYETREEADVTRKDSDKSYKGTQIYEIAEELDTSLAERYLENVREIDEDFIVELYRVVDANLATEDQ